jgi:hypothetical protein
MAQPCRAAVVFCSSSKSRPQADRMQILCALRRRLITPGTTPGSTLEGAADRRPSHACLAIRQHRPCRPRRHAQSSLPAHQAAQPGCPVWSSQLRWGCLLQLQDGDGVPPGPVAAAAGHVDGAWAEDEGDVTSLEHAVRVELICRARHVRAGPDPGPGYYRPVLPSSARTASRRARRATPAQRLRCARGLGDSVRGPGSRRSGCANVRGVAA